MNDSAASLTGVPRPCGMNFHASGTTTIGVLS
jgi:hypothetical protein